MTIRTWMTTVALGAIAGAAASSAWADPPERVGRIAYVRGEVSVLPPEQQDWSPAQRNFPVTQSEAFWTEPDATAELQIGPIETFLAGGTELLIDKLDYGVTQFSLAEGVIHIELSRVTDGGVRIETPQGEVRLEAAGAYRIDAGASDTDEPSPLRVTTLAGRASIAGPGVLVPVPAGQMAMVRDNYRVEVGQGGPVGIDDFAHQQLVAERYNSGPIYVSDEYSGYEDLDVYGTWDSDPDYGRIWYPRAVAIDWAPYRFGHWAHVYPWGWTWIDDSPWGFAPFHYGRWAQVRGRWCWVPGERAPRPVYAPALVAFIGGGGVSFSIGSNIGWVPLGPREIYRPYYAVSTTYIRNVNIHNADRRVVNTITVNNITNIQVNNYHNAVATTVVPHNTFAGAARVQGAIVRDAGLQTGNVRGGPNGAVRSGPQSIDIAKIAPTPAARAGGAFNAQAGGAPPHAAAPRHDFRKAVIKAPTPTAVPTNPTAPAMVHNGPIPNVGASSGPGDRQGRGGPGNATLRQNGQPGQQGANGAQVGVQGNGQAGVQQPGQPSQNTTETRRFRNMPAPPGGQAGGQPAGQPKGSGASPQGQGASPQGQPNNASVNQPRLVSPTPPSPQAQSGGSASGGTGSVGNGEDRRGRFDRGNPPTSVSGANPSPPPPPPPGGERRLRNESVDQQRLRAGDSAHPPQTTTSAPQVQQHAPPQPQPQPHAPPPPAPHAQPQGNDHRNDDKVDERKRRHDDNNNTP